MVIEKNFEDEIIYILKSMGWNYKKPEDLPRSDNDILLYDIFKEKINKINNGILSSKDIKNIIDNLESKPANDESEKYILDIIKTGMPLKLEKSKEIKYVKLIDYENIDNNDFLFSNQVYFETNNCVKKPDIIMYINGIPIVIMENKNQFDINLSWYDAYNDIRNYYEKYIPELFKYVQIGIASHALIKYFPVILGNDTYVAEWKNKSQEDIIRSNLCLLNKNIIIDLLKNFIFIRSDNGKLNKIMARYMQYNAVNKIFERVKYNLEGKTDKNSGLIWHWQGSGKTLTMIFSAYKLYTYNELENPTIFFIVDRTELQEQILQEISSLDLPNFKKPELVESINDLKDLIKYDNFKGKRGIFIILMQKFRDKDLKDLDILIKENNNNLKQRKNIIMFIDEIQRTQYGKLAKQMRDIFKNAFFFGFTGTPIDKYNRNTYTTFSYPDKGELYLDKYFILDSINDKFTVPITIQTRLDKDFNVKKELIDKFLEMKLEEIPEDEKDKVNKKINKNINKIEIILKNPERIKKISVDIACNFKNNFDNKFKAMVVAVDREACVIYYNELKKLLPEDYLEIVMTQNLKKDNDDINNYFKELYNKYKSNDLNYINKKIVYNFKNNEFPKILIVTNMLLTGFDAPNLGVMYMDKPMKGHTLLQAIARTNRPYNDLKESGLIIDYTGIMEKFEKAISMYDIYDINEISNNTFNMEHYVKSSEDLIKNIKTMLYNFKFDANDINDIESAGIYLINNNDAAKNFIDSYRKLRKLFYFLGHYKTDNIINDFQWITLVYNYYINTVKIDDENSEIYYHNLYNDLLKEVYHNTNIGENLEELPKLTLNKEYLSRLEKLYDDDEKRSYDMLFTLRKFLSKKSGNPLYETVSEKIEKIINDWNNKKIEIKNEYKELQDLINKVNEINDGERNSGLMPPAYIAKVIMDNMNINSTGMINKFNDEIKEKGFYFNGWNKKSDNIKALLRALNSLLIKNKFEKNVRDDIIDKVRKSYEEY
ncbi:type I restriction endonuclease subunit R [Picrophilus oshimae]|uniref:type I site-specific deoxyribonuclease n=1 Tax=Picrophilus torridus (strain ATCC 700027 / DSM 9790 / JCM 10055 / NBRC 100828 / KAW 2/3) TaxID=1122961 RepID=Q6L2Z0_PICTO|nr:HsdR family type I site-specific deoxyribonuclease [Picrophilus oshimae]AAT42661.1 type I restriction-modification system restriction subunit [Picrophilus oshimae DSM 9789]